MKSILITLFVIALAGNLSAAEPQTSPPPVKGGARIQFDNTTYDFGKIDAGTIVKHAYIFTNTGNEALEITSVQPSCGCTTAGTFDRHVLPGKTGSIPLEFNSGGWDGQVAKSAKISCSDPTQPEITLLLKGVCWLPVTVSPVLLNFTVAPDHFTNETRVVKIINRLDEPMTLSDLQSTNPAFKAEFKTIQEGKEFELLVTDLPPFNSPKVWSPIMFKTSSPRMPEITVNCYAYTLRPLAVSPSQISLSPGPLNPGPKVLITVVNNTTNYLSLSDPSINIEGAQLKITEVEPGKSFTLTAIFPDNFNSKIGQMMEATVKTSDPKNPEIKIPILQMPGFSDTQQPASTPLASH